MKRQNGILDEKQSILLFDFDTVCGSSVTDEEIPEEFILPPDRIPTCRDQKWSNQCTCFAAAGILEIFNLIKTGERKLYSTTYMYGRLRDESMRKVDAGVVKQFMKYLTMLGSIPYEMMPELRENPDAYDYVRSLDNLDELDIIASESAIDSYVGINSADDSVKIPQIKKALLKYRYPLYAVYRISSKESHAVALVGWTKDKFIFMNSWGPTTGDNGICKKKWDQLKYAYLFLDDMNKPVFPFTDVSEDKWFYHAVNRCYNAGIVNGVDDTHFLPDAELTRAQIAQALYNLAKKLAAFNGVDFKDVNRDLCAYIDDVEEDQWFYKAVNYAVSKDLFGDVGKVFNPDGTLNRGDFCGVIWCFIRSHCYSKELLEPIGDGEMFGDVFTDDANYEAIVNCFNLCLINGVSDFCFMPGASLSRAQMCQIIYKLIKLIEEYEA